MTSYLDRELISRCAESCEACAEQFGGLSPDRHVPIYCRDTAAKCYDLLSALDRSDDLTRHCELCIHSAERCATTCEATFYEISKAAGRLCRELATACRKQIAASVKEIA